MTISQSGNDWIVTPTNTTVDDVTYSFDVRAKDDCMSLGTTFRLHVGCPTAASYDTYTFV